MQEFPLDSIRPVQITETAPVYDAGYYAMTIAGWVVVAVVVIWVGATILRIATRNAANARHAATKAAAATIEVARRARDAVAAEAHRATGNTQRIQKEEDAYALASGEIESDTVQKGLWAKAFADADGDQQKQKALYLKYRASQILNAL